MKLSYNQILITDPCYIKMISDSSNSPRFDALKLVKVLHEGDDGEYMIKAGDEKLWGIIGFFERYPEHGIFGTNLRGCGFRGSR